MTRGMPQHAVPPGMPSSVREGNAAAYVVAGVLLLSLTFLGGCASTAVIEDRPLPEPIYPPAYERSEGSLYDGQGGLMLFGDQRARHVGDVLTVVLQERTSATKSASTSTSKGQSLGVQVPNFFGQVQEPANFGADASADRSFEGAGNSSQSNQLTGQLTVQVVEELNGGVLRIAGSKRLRLNQGVEVLQLTGLVRPQDIAPDNTVPSHRIANAEIGYSGRGAVADANAQGWLARFFNSPFFPL